MTQSPVIHWFRRDLRLDDNIALHQAIQSGKPIMPVFIIDPRILRSTRFSPARMAFMLSALHSLNARLKMYASELIVRTGYPESILPELVQQTEATALYFNRDYTPFARKRDTEVQHTVSVPVHSYDDALLLPPDRVLKEDGDPYLVFTPFKNRWNEQAKPTLSSVPFTKDSFYNSPNLQNDGVPTAESLGIQTSIPIPPASEALAQEKLAVFGQSGIKNYRIERNYLSIDPFNPIREAGSSYLSPYFRFGILSPRQAYWMARDKYVETVSADDRESIISWVSELTWREFYMHIMFHFPHVDKGNFRPQYDALKWRTAPEELEAWKDGQTGYPIIDAAMRQLQAIGWLPNRARMIVASFLTKDLLIHWQEGEAHFMRYLIDGDPAANNGGWQWSAGTGTDAQPYFRIFNPVSQSKKFDPTGQYIRHWVPELRNVPDKFIHEPWKMEKAPTDYPEPIVDHAFARERTLNAFKAIK